METHPESFRLFLAYANGRPLAGAVFLDDSPTSTYLMAFQRSEGKPYHLGLALVDRWFEDSLAQGFRFLDFDHLRDVFNSRSYAGYTKFKSELAGYELKFRDVWVKAVWTG